MERLTGNHTGFLQKHILLQISDRCEILVWRSLARRAFMLSGSQGDASNKRAPTMALHDLVTLATFLERKALLPLNTTTTEHTVNGLKGGQWPHTNSIFIFPKASDVQDHSRPADLAPLPDGYTDPDLIDVVDPSPPLLPTMEIVESIVASLVEQDLLHGFISHSQRRFAITGAKNASPLQVGFPNVFGVIKAKADVEVPGWVKEKSGSVATATKYGPGMVVNLSGARPAGTTPS